MHLQNTSDKRKRLAGILTFVALPLSGFMTDIYLPSFPSMAQQLDVPEKSIQLTLTYFFLSYGVAQLFVGSILDSFGRRKPVLYSLVAMILCSLAIANTDHIGTITLLRIVQGIATAFMVVAKRAFFVDLYEGDQRKHYLSYFTIVWSCGPILAPFLGGYLEALFGWSSNFYFLACYALLVLIGELWIGGETLTAVVPFHAKKLARLYGSMLGNSRFVLGVVVLGLSYAATMVFNIAGPFVVHQHFGLGSVVIGYCTLALGIAWMVGGIVSKKFTPLDFGTKNAVASILQILLITSLILMGIDWDSLLLLLVFAFLIHVASGFMFTNFFVHNLLFFPQNAGMAGGLMGGLLYIITSLASYAISSSGSIQDSWDMGLRYGMISLPLFVVVLLAIRPKHR